MYKAVIFDLDGTLLDTIDDLKQAVNCALKEKGIKEITREQTFKSVGNGFRNLLKNAVAYDSEAKVSEEEIDELVKRYEYHYSNCYLKQSKPYSGILELLEKLNQNNIKIAINTNKRQSFAENLHQHFFKQYNFLKVMGENKDYPKKPDPYAANELVKLFGLNKNEVLYVGDSEVDLNTAINAGLDVCFVSWGFRSLEQVKHIDYNYIADDTKQLEAIILK